MESEPRREPQRYYLKFENENIELGPDNTLIYSHRSDKKYDHIYVQIPEDDDDAEQRGVYMWRIDPKYTHQFETMVSNLLSINVTMITHNDISEFDLKQWTARFAGRPTRPVQGPEPAPEEPTKEMVAVLTDRQIGRANFLGYLLLHEHLTADDFDGEGDLYI